jgi:hypothetical protein
MEHRTGTRMAFPHQTLLVLRASYAISSNTKIRNSLRQSQNVFSALADVTLSGSERCESGRIEAAFPKAAVWATGP